MTIEPNGFLPHNPSNHHVLVEVHNLNGPTYVDWEGFTGTDTPEMVKAIDVIKNEVSVLVEQGVRPQLYEAVADVTLHYVHENLEAGAPPSDDQVVEAFWLVAMVLGNNMFMRSDIKWV